MKRLGCLAAFVLILSACNNDSFRQLGTNPLPAPNLAPPPPTGAFVPPPTGQNPGGGYPGQFNPQLPPGYPNQYTPFVPLDNYFRRTPGMVQDWNTIWNGWQQYAPSAGYNVYDFYPFWNDYFYQVANYNYGGYYSNLFQFYDQNVYYWVQPGMQFQNTYSGSFWQNYVGVPFYQLDYSYGYCGVCWN